jgi:hypothetical protein
VCVCVCATCLVEAGPCVHAMEATVVLSYGFAWASKMMQFVSAGVVLGWNMLVLLVAGASTICIFWTIVCLWGTCVCVACIHHCRPKARVPPMMLGVCVQLLKLFASALWGCVVGNLMILVEQSN